MLNVEAQTSEGLVEILYGTDVVDSFTVPVNTGPVLYSGFWSVVVPSGTNHVFRIRLSSTNAGDDVIGTNFAIERWRTGSGS